jgi:hypothetical protein
MQPCMPAAVTAIQHTACLEQCNHEDSSRKSVCWKSVPQEASSNHSALSCYAPLHAGWPVLHLHTQGWVS